MKAIFALFGLFLIFAGISFAEDNVTNYTHYCFRTCCLDADAIYSEGPPQKCTNPGPDFEQSQQRCMERCMHDLGFYYNGSDYIPPGISSPPPEENASAQVQPNESALPKEEPLLPANVSAPEPIPSNLSSVPLPQKGDYPEKEKTGGLCTLGFALLFPLFFRKYGTNNI